MKMPGSILWLCFCKRFLRRFVDIRITAMLVGFVSFQYGMIPLHDLGDSSLFAKALAQSRFELEFSATFITLGAGLMLCSVIKWRSMLLWCEALSALAWFSVWLVFRDMDIITPVTETMLCFSLGVMMCLAREIALGLQVHRARGSSVPVARAEGFADLQGAG